MTDHFSLNFSLTAPSLMEQTGLHTKPMKQHDLDMRAIQRLYLRGVLTQGERAKSEIRLLKQIGRTCKNSLQVADAPHD